MYASAQDICIMMAAAPEAQAQLQPPTFLLLPSPSDLNSIIFFSGAPPRGCCGLVNADLSMTIDDPPLTRAPYLRYIVTTATRLLAFCCREGWPALAARVGS